MLYEVITRFDAPGTLHDVIGRGIERREIFTDDIDRDDFIARLSRLLNETQTLCYAWALIPNHFHLLLRIGTTPLSMLMRRLLTGYAVAFNHRHQRVGHLFQNRVITSYSIHYTKLYDDLVLNTVSRRGDAALCFWLSNHTRQPMDVVLREYRAHKGQGWGVLAKSLGIKPGSEAFPGLKRGDLG